MKNSKTILLLAIIMALSSILALAVGCGELTGEKVMSAVTLTGARLSWDVVDGAEEYYVNVMFSDVSGYEVSLSNTSYTISHNKAGDYYYKVRAKIRDKFTQYSETFIYHLGIGSREDPITIGSREELEKITTGLRTVTNENNDVVSVPIYYIQTNDIDLGNEEWTPIGTNNNVFKGIYDGGGYNISGLKITKVPESSSNIATGLFGLVQDAVIKNVNIIEPYIDITYAVTQFSVGALIGRSTTSVVKNCSVTGDVRIYAPATGENILYAGLVIGESRGTGMSNLFSSGSLQATFSRVYAGGIVGITKTSASDIINNCVSYADVKSHGTGRTSSEVTAISAAGGIAGYLSYANAVEYCYYSGSLQATAIDGAMVENIYKGMFGGAQNSGQRCNILLKQCYFNIDKLGIEHDETDKTPEQIQAMYASIAENYTVGNCNKLKIGSTAYGIIDEAEGLNETYSGFDFENVWTIAEGKPALLKVVLPTVLPMSNVTLDGAVIRWEAVEGAAAYYVYNVNEDKLSTVYDLNYTISETEPGAYSYKVYARVMGEQTDYSDMVTYIIEVTED